MSPCSILSGTLVQCNMRQVHANLPQPQRVVSQEKLPPLKFAPSSEGPYVIVADMGKGCYDLASVDGDNSLRVNVKYVKVW